MIKLPPGNYQSNLSPCVYYSAKRCIIFLNNWIQLRFTSYGTSHYGKTLKFRTAFLVLGLLYYQYIIGLVLSRCAINEILSDAEDVRGNKGNSSIKFEIRLLSVKHIKPMMQID